MSSRGSIRIAGSSTTSAPSAAQGRRDPARLRAGAGDDHPPAPERPALEPGDRLAARGDRAEEQDRRARASPASATAAGKLGERRGDRPLPGLGAALDRGRRLGRVAARGGQRSAISGRLLDAHVEHERAREAGERLPVERRLGLLRILVAGDEGDRRGVVAMGDRDPGVGRRGDSRR